VRDLGIADQDIATVRRLRTINILVLLACLIMVSYGTFYAIYDARHFRSEILFLLAMTATYPMVLLASGAGRVDLATWLLIGVALLQLGVINWLLGPDAGSLGYLLATPFVATLVIREGDRFTIWPVAIVVSVIFMVMTFSGRAGSIATLPEAAQRIFFFVNILGALALACGISLYFRRLIARAEVDLAAEKARSDRLLRAILPDAIAERLKARKSEVIARHYPAATVVFADIVGFTERSSRIDANQIVAELNRVFSAIDALADGRGIEKIKTIGDAYFAVCGLPDPVPDHAARVADFALDVRADRAEWARTLWPDLDFRIVLNTGPVVAGVIGRTKFAYDVWGDTINTAARLEEVCPAGDILITDAVAAALPDRFATEDLGEVELRDKGRVRLHRLRDRDAD